MTTGELVALLRRLPFAADDDVLVLQSAQHDWRIDTVVRRHHVVHIGLTPIDGSVYQGREDSHATARNMATED